jgi:hypothetical protein
VIANNNISFAFFKIVPALNDSSNAAQHKEKGHPHIKYLKNIKGSFGLGQ